jgi:hypothetical protein
VRLAATTNNDVRDEANLPETMLVGDKGFEPLTSTL